MTINKIPYGLTQDDVSSLISFVNGDNDTVVDDDAIERLLRLANDVQRKLLSNLRRETKSNLRLTSKVQDLETTKKKTIEAKVEAGAFEALGLESIDIAKVIIHYLKANDFYVTQKKVVMLLYMVYSWWLYKNREVITIDAPVTQAWGPQFWRAYSHFNEIAQTNEIPSYLGQNYSGIVAVTKNIVAKYGNYMDKALSDYLCKTTPYMRAVERGNGKWNSPLDNTEIYHWRKSK